MIEVTICLATYVQRRIERREKLPPRKVPTHLEITGKKKRDQRGCMRCTDGIKNITCMVSIIIIFCTFATILFSFYFFLFFFFSLDNRIIIIFG